MAQTTRFTADARDAGIRRVARANRWLIAGAVGLTGALYVVAAQAFPGKTINPSGSGTAASTPGPPHRSHRSRRSHRPSSPVRHRASPTPLRAPAQAPAPVQQSTPPAPPVQASTPPPAPVQTSTPAPPVAVSGGS